MQHVCSSCVGVLQPEVDLTGSRFTCDHCKFADDANSRLFGRVHMYDLW